MALFCSPFETPILCPKFPRNCYAIRSPLTSIPSILTTPHFQISKITPTKILNKKAKCRLNSSSSVESHEGPPSSAVIFVKGLAQSTGEGGLKAAFSPYGEVSRVKLVLDKKTKQSLGYAYVWFLKEEHAQTAIEEMNGQFLEGRFIHVALAKPGSCKTRPRPSVFKF